MITILEGFIDWVGAVHGVGKAREETYQGKQKKGGAKHERRSEKID
jgi:hypothetical protein